MEVPYFMPKSVSPPLNSVFAGICGRLGRGSLFPSKRDHIRYGQSDRCDFGICFATITTDALTVRVHQSGRARHRREADRPCAGCSSG